MFNTCALLGLADFTACVSLEYLSVVTIVSWFRYVFRGSGPKIPMATNSGGPQDTIN